MVSVLLFALFGLVVGLVARALVPGPQRLGCLGTTLLGIGGSLLGGLLANLLTDNRTWQLKPAGFLGSVVGAALLLGVWLLLTRQRTT
jgi:uncharacterized membrane protein YeaQ/YmgE (transglycosylase-associated protein family)